MHNDLRCVSRSMSPQERARRVAAGLNQSQVANLGRWGYPYLFADFMFHMTLTGKVSIDRRDEVLDTLRRAFDRACKDHVLTIERISLMRKDDGQFIVPCHRAGHAAAGPLNHGSRISGWPIRMIEPSRTWSHSEKPWAPGR